GRRPVGPRGRRSPTMNETTVRGNIIGAPTSRRGGDDPVFSFRVASNTRYQDRESGEWKNGSTLYFTASCWGRLAEKAGGRLVKGDAVILSGRLLTNEYERDGVMRRDLEMRVAALGPDMARMDVTVRRPGRRSRLRRPPRSTRTPTSWARPTPRQWGSRGPTTSPVRTPLPRGSAPSRVPAAPDAATPGPRCPPRAPGPCDAT